MKKDLIPLFVLAVLLYYSGFTPKFIKKTEPKTVETQDVCPRPDLSDINYTDNSEKELLNALQYHFKPEVAHIIFYDGCGNVIDELYMPEFSNPEWDDADQCFYIWFGTETYIYKGRVRPFEEGETVISTDIDGNGVYMRADLQLYYKKS